MYLIQTVQTSWRPQLPLPKEITNVNATRGTNHSSEMDKNSSKKDINTSKKWSFGRLFRKKKEIPGTNSSSDEDRKAGFISPQKPKRKERKRHGNKSIGTNFDNIVISLKENEIFLPLSHIDSSDPNRSTNSLDRRVKWERKRTAFLAQNQSSSEDDIRSHNSHNSSSISRYRSDESMGSGGVGNRKSRSARNERYYKRRGGKDEMQMLHVTQQVGRWKTQPVEMQMEMNGQFKSRQGYSLKGSTSLTNVPFNRKIPTYVTPPVSICSQPPPFSTSNQNHPVNDNKRSISYDNDIYLQNKNFQERSKTPPPPPPRDPLRRVNLHHGEMRPISYAFDKTPSFTSVINERCVSDDRLWGQNGSIYQSYLAPRPSSTQPSMQPMLDKRRLFIKSPENAFNARNYNSTSNEQDLKYVTDAIPRSRRPIHVFNDEDALKISSPAPSSVVESPHIIRTTKSGLPSSSIQTASNFWKKIDQGNTIGRGRDRQINNNSRIQPRSVSSSRVEEPRSYSNLMVENLHRNNENENEGKYRMMGYHSRNQQPKTVSNFGEQRVLKVNSFNNRDEVDRRNVLDTRVEGSWPTKTHFAQSNNNFNEADSTKKLTSDYENVVNGSLFIKPIKDSNAIRVCNKSSSMPNYYQRNVNQMQKSMTPPLSRCEIFIGNKPNSNTLDYNRNVIQKSGGYLNPSYKDDASEMSGKSTNLEDAINELEAIYKSLELGDEDLLERAERRDIPKPTDFEKYAKLVNEFSFDNDEESTGEPDVVRDDVVYRNIKHANSILKTVDPQPPFGIPIGPIPPSPKTDYLHVTPEKDTKKNRCLPHNNIPDIIGDDLAVRALRKEPPGSSGLSKFVYPSGSLKKKRATRSQSANIYNLIQRDASKPSGGNLYDYFDLDRSIERSGSVSDLKKQTDDIPSTLYLLRSLQEEDQKLKSKQSLFRHPNQGGAVYNLPLVLRTNDPYGVQKQPVPLPRKSLSPAPGSDVSRSGMEEILNQIAKEAKESSEKLSKDLEALRKESTFKNSALKKSISSSSNAKVEKDIRDIEETSLAAKHYEKVLNEIMPPEPELSERPPEKEKKPMENNSKGSAEKEKLLEDIVITEHPPVIQVAQTMCQGGDVPSSCNQKNQTGKEFPNENDKSTLLSLIEKIDPKSRKIDEIASRCVRQINALNDLTDEPTSSGPDYDNLKSTNLKRTACKDVKGSSADHVNIQNDSVVPGQSGESSSNSGNDNDKLLKKCESKNQKLHKNCKPSSTSDGSNGAVFSFSDYLKSTSSSSARQPSSSITSAHDFSSSDCIKSSSSDANPPSTDPIKTFSTTSYDVASSSTTPNVTNTSPSLTPSPPLNNTVNGGGGGGSNLSDYNSSEELAMIFGNHQGSPATTAESSKNSGNTQRIAHACDHRLFNKNANHNINDNIISLSDICYDYHSTSQHEQSIEISSVSPILTTNTNSETLPTNNNSIPTDFYNNSNNSDIFLLSDICMATDNKHKPNRFNNYFSNKINIELNNHINSNDSNDFPVHSLSLCSLNESNPSDSGNVSLNEFPVQNSINTSLELSLLHNTCCIEIPNGYSFINQIEIQRFNSTDGKNDNNDVGDGIRNCNHSENNITVGSAISTKQNGENIKNEVTTNNVNNIDVKMNKQGANSGHDTNITCKNENFAQENIATSSHKTPHFISSSDDNNCSDATNHEFRQRSSVANQSQCSPSTSNPKCLSLLSNNRQNVIHHAILACTYIVVSNDFYTFIIVILSMITIIALILL